MSYPQIKTILSALYLLCYLYNLTIGDLVLLISTDHVHTECYQLNCEGLNTGLDMAFVQKAVMPNYTGASEPVWQVRHLPDQYFSKQKELIIQALARYK